MTIIPALERVRQEDLEFEASLDFIGRPCLKKEKKKIQIGGKTSNVHELEDFTLSGCPYYSK
jgi:hypothetical protein